MILGVVFCGYIQWNPSSLRAIFTKDTAVIKEAALYLRSYGIDCIARWLE